MTYESESESEIFIRSFQTQETSAKTITGRCRRGHHMNRHVCCRMLDLTQMLQFDQFKKAYAEILYRWELLNTRAEILKYVSTPSQPHKGLGT